MKITAPIGTLIILGLMLVAVTLISPLERSPPVRSVQSETITANDTQDDPAQTQSIDERAQADLEAQQSMARWAFWMVIVSASSVMVAVTAVILVFLTWKEAKKTTTAVIKANKSAELSARASQDAVEVARFTAERELRAYVFVSDTTWRIAKHPETDVVTSCSLTIEWKNCGATPALRSRVMANSDVLAGDLPSNYPYPDFVPSGSAMSARTQRSNIGPGQPIQSRVGVKLPDAQLVAKNERSLFVWGWVEYDDIFVKTPRRRTEVCMRVVIANDLKSCTSTVIGPFNGADEDCYHQPKT